MRRVLHTLAEAMYRETTSGAAGGSRSAGEPRKDDVVDAEFKDVDDRKP